MLMHIAASLIYCAAGIGGCLTGEWLVDQYRARR